MYIINLHARTHTHTAEWFAVAVADLTATQWQEGGAALLAV